MQDILKFGVDKLLNDETEEVDMDFTRMLGPTVDGEWQTEEGVRGQEEEEEVGLELLISSANVSKAVNKCLAS